MYCDEHKELTPPQMGVNAHVSGRSAQTLSFPIRNVLLRLGVTVLFRHPEVHNMHN